MEKNISNLMEIIEQESEVLEILSDLLYRQKAAAIEGDIEMLNRITEAQGRAYEKIAELETRRREVIEPIAQELDMRPEEVTLSILKERMKGGSAGQWERVQKLIGPLVKKVRHSAKLNRIVLKRCLQLGEQRLKMMLDFRGQQDLYKFTGKKSQANKNSGVAVNKKI